MADNALQPLVKQLNQGEGKPDILARREILDHLVDNELSRWETRYLRDRLNAIPLEYDILMNLPIELFLIITQLLDFQDFLIAFEVSRAWKQRFSSPDVCLNVTKRHFRSTWENSYNSLASKDQELAKYKLSQWLPGAAANRLRRQHYKCRSWKSFEYGKDHGPGYIWPGPADFVDGLYNNGTVGFLVTKRTITVQAVTGDERPRSFQNPDRAPIEVWLLSDRFLIAQSSSNPLVLGAWDHKLEPEANVRLPNPARTLSAHHQRVGIVTQIHEVLVWQVGGNLKHLDTSALRGRLDKTYHWDVCCVLFHPSDKDTTFVVHQGLAASRFRHDNQMMTKLIIQEFIGDQPKAAFYVEVTLTLPLSREEFARHESPIRAGFYSVTRAIVSPDGLCSIWQTYVLPEDQYSHVTRDVAFVTFDMYERKFDINRVIPQHFRGRAPGIPDYPGGVGRIIHGQEVIAMPGGWRQLAPDLACASRDDVVQGDDDFVVIFGKESFAVAVLE